MSIDYLVMIFTVVCIVFLIFIFIEKKNIKKAFLAALVAEFFTWPIGLMLTYLGKIEYPVRLFPKAINSSFLNGYILNPLIYSLYYIYYPKHAKLIWRIVYTVLFTTIPVSLESLENRFTNLVKYKDWSGYHSWILGIFLYYIIRKYLDWFFRNVSKEGVPNYEN